MFTVNEDRPMGNLQPPSSIASLVRRTRGIQDATALIRTMMLFKPSSQETFVPQKDARQRDDFHTLSVHGDHRIVDTSSAGRRPRLVVGRFDVSEENASDWVIRKSHTARSFRHWIV
jgi:hypothetical protein